MDSFLASHVLGKTAAEPGGVGLPLLAQHLLSSKYALPFKNPLIKSKPTRSRRAADEQPHGPKGHPRQPYWA